MTGNAPCEADARDVSWRQFLLPMKSSLASLFRPAFLALGCVLAAVSLSAADAKLPALPLQATFEQSAPGERSGPYCVLLANTSEHALTVTAMVHYSVQSHDRAKAKTLPAQEIAPGKSLKIDDLAVEDMVMVSAEGFAPLTFKVPPGKK
jgi:hypothetical protein